MEQAQICVTYSALVVGTLCFLIFTYDAVRATRQKYLTSNVAKAAAATSAEATAASPESISALSELTKGLAALAESLAKAGPSVTSIIGAVLFYAIAAVGSGALVSSDAQPETESPVTAPSPKNGAKGAMPKISKKLPPPTKQ